MSVPFGVYPRISARERQLARGLVFAAPPFLVPNNGMGDLSGYNAPFFEQAALQKRLDNHTGMAWVTGASNNYLKTAVGLPQHKGTGEVTAMCWAKKYSDNANNTLIGYLLPSVNFVWYILWDSATATFYVSSTGSSVSAQVSAARSLSIGPRYHIAAVYKPSDRLEIYVNGVLDGTSTTTIPSALFATSSAPMCMGASGSGAFQFTGELNHGYVWNRALGAGEIRRMYADPWTLYRHSMQQPLPFSLAEIYRWTPDPNIGTRPGVVLI